MTAKRCTNCRHAKGIGYDFWCGEGHTEYEVFGAETNCPYYEYHDWSKGVPSMTEKRFIFREDYDWWEIKDITGQIRGDYDDEWFSCEKVVDLLNELADENEQLKQQLKIYKNDGLETLNDLQMVYENNKKALNNIEQLCKENKELKDLLKSMADRNNEIWLDNGQIIRLEKVFKGEWKNDWKTI